MSILICKDAFQRYAAWFFDKLRKAGVEIILVPSLSINVSRSSYDIDLWVESLKTLSKWFYVCILAPGTVGPTGGEFESFGHALIIGPGSNPFIEGSEDKEQILKATLNLTRLTKLREIYESKWQPKDIPGVKVIIPKGGSKA